jgi:hypothetical protein
MEEFLRNAIESRPFTSVVAALCVGWFIGWMGRHSDSESRSGKFLSPMNRM